MNISLKGAAGFHQLGRRANQEDSRCPDNDRPDTRWFVVCDGVGGCEKGEVASGTVAGAFGRYMTDNYQADREFTADDFAAALAYAYDALEAEASADNAGMATTLTFVVFHTGGVLAAHIGDSRIYQLRPGTGVVYRSEDHSLVQAMVKSGNISADEAVNHRLGNVITRCMSADGNRCEATVVALDDIREGDFFLLCSDGVLHMIDDDYLARIVAVPDSVADKAALMASLSKDSSDNNTAFLVEVDSVDSPENAETVAIETEKENGEPAATTHIIKRSKPFCADVAPGIKINSDAAAPEDSVAIEADGAAHEDAQDGDTVVSEAEGTHEAPAEEEKPKKTSFFRKLFGSR